MKNHLTALITVLIITAGTALASMIPSTPVQESWDESQNPFPDTTITTLEGQAAAELQRREVIGGYPDGTFGGSNYVNRAEAAKFLILAANINPDSTFPNPFPDTDEGAWYYSYVLQAWEFQIIAGHPDGTFRPSDTVNTAEFIKMITRTFGLNMDEPYDYQDVSSSDWFSAYAGTAQKFNMFPDRSTGSLEPARLMTRNEVAVAIYQYLRCQYDTSICVSSSYSQASGNEGASCTSQSTCTGDNFCIRGECVDKYSLLPSNEVESALHCDYDEVYIDGQCEKAEKTVAFISNALDDEQEFNDWIDLAVAGVVELTPFKECKDKLRVIRKFDNVCIKSENYNDMQTEIYSYFDGYEPDAYFFIHPYGVFEEGCSTTDHIAITNYEDHGGLAHEIGHGFFGLWDQYCYFASPDNPNPVDLSVASCRTPENDWYQSYCSQPDKLAPGQEILQCLGNPNEYGARTIMGNATHALSSKRIGFSEEEYAIMESQIDCK